MAITIFILLKNHIPIDMIGKLVKRRLSFRDENGEPIWLYGIIISTYKLEVELSAESSYKMYNILWQENKNFPVSSGGYMQVSSNGSFQVVENTQENKSQ